MLRHVVSVLSSLRGYEARKLNRTSALRVNARYIYIYIYISVAILAQGFCPPPPRVCGGGALGRSLGGGGLALPFLYPL